MTSIANGESGSSVRTKLNSSLAVTDAFTVSGANVGVGTNSPTSFGAGATLLTVAGTTGYGGYIGATNGVTVQLFANESGSGAIGTRTNHPLAFTINNTECMRIDASGNVGIGTTSPSEKLTVTGALPSIGIAGGTGTSGSPAYTNLSFRGTTGNRTAVLRSFDQSASSALGGGFEFLVNSNMAGDTLTSAMRIDASGNVGVGATANAASIVDAQSTTKGVRFPNMTTTQKAAIANVAGNVVFDTTLGKLCVNSGSGWQTITSV